MKKLLLALALLLIPVAASAQCNGIFPNNTVCGNVGNGGNATPRPTNPASFLGAAGGTNGQIQYNNGGALGGLTDAQVYARVLPFIPTNTPGGRLTLVSGSPVISSDVVSSQNIYYAPDASPLVPINVGGILTNFSFTASATDTVGLTLSLAGSTNWAAGTIHDVFAIVNSGVAVLATRAWDSAMQPTTTQITNATTITTGTGANTWLRPTAAFNGTVAQPVASSARNSPSNTGTFTNCLGQDWGSGNSFVLTKVIVTAPTDSQLRSDIPSLLTVLTQGSNDATNWELLDTRNLHTAVGVLGQSYTIPINSSDTVAYRYHRFCVTGDGTNAVNIAQIQFFNTTAPSTRRLVKFNGIDTNDATITARINATTTVSVPANQATYLGTIGIDAGSSGSVSAYVNFGPSRVYNIWNRWNQRNITLRAGTVGLSSSISYAYNLTVPANQDWGPIEGTNTYSGTVLIGMIGDPVIASMQRTLYMNCVGPSGNCGSYESGIGVDTTAVFSGTQSSNNFDTTGQQMGVVTMSNVTLPPFFGTHTLFGVEALNYLTSGAAFSLFTDVRSSALVISYRG